MSQQPREHRRPLLIVALGSLAMAFALGAGIFFLGGQPTTPGTPLASQAAVAAPTAAPTSEVTLATPAASAEPTATPAPSRDLVAGVAPRVRQREAAMARATPTPTPPPAGPVSGGTAVGPTHRVATRVVVPALGIDLPVMPQRTSYPACNVAMYLAELSQPGQGGPTYLYAHARAGMFGALLSQSQISDGANMIGMQVHVYTGDNRVFTYRIDEVRRHTTDLVAVFARGNESLWLQTSEGPRGTVPKLQVGAHLVSSGSASHAASHPVPRPVPC